MYLSFRLLAIVSIFVSVSLKYLPVVRFGQPPLYAMDDTVFVAALQSELVFSLTALLGVLASSDITDENGLNETGFKAIVLSAVHGICARHGVKCEPTSEGRRLFARVRQL